MVITRRIGMAARRAASRIESATGLDTIHGRVTANDISQMLLMTVFIGIVLWGFTYPMESGVNRCPSCPVGVPVWMLNESDYVPIPDQMTIAGITGVIIGLRFPLRRRYAEGPLMFGKKTRYRRHYGLPGMSPIARIQDGIVKSTIERLSIFALSLVFLFMSSVSSYATGTTHTTHESYGSMKRLGEKGSLYASAWGPCQGPHCFICLSIRQHEVSKRLRTRSA